MGNIIKKCDNFGEEFELNQGRTKRKQTIPGGVFSILFIIFVTLGSMTFFFNFLSTEDPDVSTNITNVPIYPRFNLSKSNIYPMFAMIKDSSSISQKEIIKHATIIGTISQVSYPQIIPDGSSVPLITKIIDEFKFVPCSEVKSQLKTRLYAGNAPVEAYGEFYSLCPQIENENLFYVEGSYTQVPFTSFTIGIYPCSLKNKEECKGKGDVGRAMYNIISLTPSFDKGNYTQPVSFSPVSLFKLFLNYKVGKKLEIQLKKNEIFDERLDYQGETLRDEFTEIDSVNRDSFVRDEEEIYCTEEEIAKKSCLPYISIEFVSGGKTTTIKRNYKKPSELMGDIGGISEIFMLIFSFSFVLYGCVMNRKKDKEDTGIEEARVDVADALKDDFKQEEYEQLLEEFDAINHDGFEIIKSLNKYKILEDVVFEDYHKILAPIISLKILKSEFGKNKKKKEKKLSKAEKAKNLHEAILELKNDDTVDPVKKKINEFFLENLPERLLNTGNILGIETLNESNTKMVDLGRATRGEFSQPVDMGVSRFSRNAIRDVKFG